MGGGLVDRGEPEPQRRAGRPERGRPAAGHEGRSTPSAAPTSGRSSCGRQTAVRPGRSSRRRAPAPARSSSASRCGRAACGPSATSPGRAGRTRSPCAGQGGTWTTRRQPEPRLRRPALRRGDDARRDVGGRHRHRAGREQPSADPALDGHAWKTQPAPSLPKGNNQLFGIAGEGLQPVGVRRSGRRAAGRLHPLALHHTASGLARLQGAGSRRAAASRSSSAGRSRAAPSGRSAAAAPARGTPSPSGTPPSGWKAVTVPDGAGAPPRTSSRRSCRSRARSSSGRSATAPRASATAPSSSERRNGAWHQVSSPTPDPSGSFLTGVVAFSQTRAAAVGYRTPAGFRTLALIHH